jgi:UDP-N-acetylmuramoyl-tripeptide--D-alanyl-D-alanine ligase
MPEGGYPLAQACQDLVAADLLTGCLVARDGRWSHCGPVPTPNPRGEFQGAGLDSRTIQPGQLFVGLKGERSDGRQFIGAALGAGAAGALTRLWDGAGEDPLPERLTGLTSAGVVLVSADPLAALGRLAGLWRNRLRAIRIVAITGSNGKTTTKDFLAVLLGAAAPCHATAGNFNNEIGLPLTLLGLRAEHRHAAIEIGASAEGEIARLAALVRPDVGIITNAAEAHLARFGDLAGVVRGKGELLDALPATGAVVLNAESPGFAAWAERAPCPIISFGQETGDHRWTWAPGADGRGGVLWLDGQSWAVPVPGRHNAANLTAAILAARALGLTDAAIAVGLNGFAASPQRSRLDEIGGISILDDSYNANPASVRAAVAALCDLAGAGRSIAVLGLMAELGPDSERIHRSTGERLHALGLSVLVAVGPGTEPLAAGFAAAIPCVEKTDAVSWLMQHAQPGDRVLVKGSRVAAMEDVLTLWRSRLQPADKPR